MISTFDYLQSPLWAYLRFDLPLHATLRAVLQRKCYTEVHVVYNRGKPWPTRLCYSLYMHALYVRCLFLVHVRYTAIQGYLYSCQKPGDSWFWWDHVLKTLQSQKSRGYMFGLIYICCVKDALTGKFDDYSLIDLTYSIMNSNLRFLKGLTIRTISWENFLSEIANEIRVKICACARE